MDPSTQLILSVVTLLLTPLLSALVVSYQLSKGHSYWTKQQEHLQKKERFELKVEVLKRATSLLNISNDILIQHQIYASSRDIALAFSRLLLQANPNKSKYFEGEYNSFRVKTADSYLEYRNISSQLSELSAEVLAYFGAKVSQEINNYRASCGEAIKQPFSVDQLQEMLKEIVDKTNDLEAAKNAVSNIYDAKTEETRPIKEQQAILTGLAYNVLEKNG